jgi:hypothetical protein
MKFIANSLVLGLFHTCKQTCRVVLQTFLKDATCPNKPEVVQSAPGMRTLQVVFE